MESFKAYSKHGGIVADTPKDAAAKFFDKFPNARKCDIIAGVVDGSFFTVAFQAGRKSTSWDNVTRKTQFN